MMIRFFTMVGSIWNRLGLNSVISDGKFRSLAFPACAHQNYREKRLWQIHFKKHKQLDFFIMVETAMSGV